MDLLQFYNNIQSPTHDSKLVEKLIELYSDTIFDGQFYSKLERAGWTPCDSVSVEDKDRFYSMMFNKWKNNILTLNNDDIPYERVRSSYKELKRILKKVPDVNTKKEVDDIILSDYFDERLRRCVWSSETVNDYWVYVYSSYITPYQKKMNESDKEKYNIKHRLYLNVQPSEIYKMANLIVEKCDKYQLAYRFKFSQDKYADRDDSLVIYCATHDLMKYYEILQEIKKEHPELISKIKSPPILTGIVDDWIGYGSEPSICSTDGEPYSFNSLRVEFIPDAIKNATFKWIDKNKNKLVDYQGKKITFKDYLVDFLTNYMSNKGDSYFDTEKFTKEDVQKIMSSRIDGLLKDLLSNECGNFDLLANDLDPSKGGYYRLFFETILKTKISKNILKFDSNFTKNVQEEIEDLSSYYCIDSDKFCFDASVVENMKSFYEKSEKKPWIIKKKGNEFGRTKVGGIHHNDSSSVVQVIEREVEQILALNLTDEQKNTLIGELANTIVLDSSKSKQKKII